MDKKIFLILVLVFLAINVSGQEFQRHYDLHLNDFDHIFNSEQSQYLEKLLAELEENTSAEVVIVTVSSTMPYTPQEYRTKLFDAWDIGKEDKDNGLLILYVTGENRIEVETGYGLEGMLPDSKVGRMLDDYYVPLRDEGNVNEGIIFFTEEVAIVIEENADEVMSGNAGGNTSRTKSVILMIIFIIIIINFHFKA